MLVPEFWQFAESLYLDLDEKHRFPRNWEQVYFQKVHHITIQRSKHYPIFSGLLPKSAFKQVSQQGWADFIYRGFWLHHHGCSSGPHRRHRQGLWYSCWAIWNNISCWNRGNLKTKHRAPDGQIHRKTKFPPELTLLAIAGNKVEWNWLLFAAQ